MVRMSVAALGVGFPNTPVLHHSIVTILSRGATKKPKARNCLRLCTIHTLLPLMSQPKSPSLKHEQNGEPIPEGVNDVEEK